MGLEDWLCPVCQTYRPTPHIPKMEERLEEYRKKIIREFFRKHEEKEPDLEFRYANMKKELEDGKK